MAGVVIDTTADASNVTALMTNTDVTSIELGKAAKPTLSALEETICTVNGTKICVWRAGAGCCNFS